MNSFTISTTPLTLSVFSRCILLTVIISLAFAVRPVTAENLILTFRQQGKDFEDAYRGLKTELRNECELKEHILDKNCSVKEVTTLMNDLQPKLVVLMDNTSIALYRKYQESLGENDPVVPSVAIMGVMVKKALHHLKNASGISYEIPIVTSLVSLRAVLETKLKKVGVVHREFLDDFIAENRTYCRNEGIDIINISLPNKSRNFSKLLKKSLDDLDKKGIDALWVPNDNALLDPVTIKNAWIPAARKFKIPFVVGVEVLVNPKLNFGTFAVLPDHISLGSQVAEMVYEIMENNWKIEELHVEPPLAVYKIINLPQAKKYFHVSDEQLKSVDKKLK
ncbi:MAG: hypothetical protein JW863_07325 [Chitinispirillaceae bacterium]|nr:hypothetical protein [Chitinispirillaceae bacterium]